MCIGALVFKNYAVTVFEMYSVSIIH